MTAPLLFQHVVCPVAGSRQAVMSVVVVVVLLLVVEVLVVVVLLPPGGATLSAKVPLAPLYPSTMMKYVCPAVTVGVMREAWNRPLELTHASSLHPTATPPPPTPAPR